MSVERENGALGGTPSLARSSLRHRPIAMSVELTRCLHRLHACNTSLLTYKRHCQRQAPVRDTLGHTQSPRLFRQTDNRDHSSWPSFDCSLSLETNIIGPS